MAKKRSRGPPKLPSKQLAILAICRFAEPVALTSVFPYLVCTLALVLPCDLTYISFQPEMIESFGVEKKSVAKWAGITSAVFSLAQCLTAVIWGRASDKFGRKPTILIALSCTAIASNLWGMATNLPVAILARAFAGACNGNVGIIRTMVAEMVPEKELQPRAFSIMPLVWTIGSIFGPSFGGFFAKPVENLPALFKNSKFFQKYPFELPNLVATILFLIGISTGVLFLRETLETKRHKTDYGREAGKRLVSCFKTIFRLHPKPKPFRRHSAHDESSAALLRPPSSAGSDSSKAFDEAFDRPTKPPPPRPTMTEVFTRQSVINLAAYTFLALHSVAYDQLLPIFLHNPKQSPNSPNIHLPLKFAGGFGLASGRIGTLFTLYGICGCFIQFIIFPPTARRFGVLNCFKCCAIAFPLICFSTPFTALIHNSAWQQTVMFGIMLVKSFAVIFAFPCSIILLTNSAVSLRILGTLNGFAVSISAVGRAIGPALGGAAFTFGLEHGYMITPWWLIGIIAMIGAVPIWFLVEMDGFSKTDSDSEDEESSDELPEPGLETVDEEPDAEILAGDEMFGLDPDDEALDMVDGPPLSRLPSRKSVDGGLAPPRREPKFERRMSSPIGIRGGSVGPGGGRRLSNGLAASNMGQGTGGTSFT